MWWPFGKKNNQSDLIPLEKLRANLEKCGPKQKKIVLISTGSYNPVHKMHLGIFEAAKKELEKDPNVAVIGGFLSPSHDMYVSRKLGKEHIKSDHRVKMCSLLLEDHPWVSVSGWECAQSDFTDFPEVVSTHEEIIQKKFPSHEFSVHYLCGSDLALRCNLSHPFNFLPFPVTCVARPDSAHKLRERMKKRTEEAIEALFRLVDVDEEEDVSSTMVRNGLREGTDIEFLVGAAVALYLKEMKN